MTTKTKKATEEAVKEKATIKAVKKQLKDNAIKGTEQSEKEKTLFEKCLDEASLPIKFTDADFKLGKGELDIRNLSYKNRRQLEFRLNATALSLARQNAQQLIDIERVLLLVLKYMGCKDVVAELDILLADLEKQGKEEVKKASTQKDNNKA